jgi:hypothetical protein
MDYETLKSEYVNYGRNKFIEISKKRVTSENAVFLNISKGYYTPDGDKRYHRGIGFPPEDAIVDGILGKLRDVMDSVDESEKSQPQPEQNNSEQQELDD